MAWGRGGGAACKSVTGLDKMRWRQGVGGKEMEEGGGCVGAVLIWDLDEHEQA